MNILHNVPLADKNWFQTGGAAQLYCRPQNAQEFQEAVAFAKINNLPIFVLGKGANILISDNGFEGLVIHPAERPITHTPVSAEQALVTASAGTDFPELITYCLNNQLLGLEEFSGIPGTVGGSVFINIHYFEFLLGQFLTSAVVLDTATNELITVDNAWFKFGYNTTTLHDKRYILVEATFKVKRCTELEAAFAKGRSLEIIRHRNQRYPKSHTCGSFFRNFYEHEVTLTSNGKKMIYVAYYLDKIGVKGALSQGDAIVSYQHANMLVNRGSATSQDIVELAKKMQMLVFEQYGIMPQSECQFVGFGGYPLLSMPTSAHERSLELSH
jgi:UDP-N-acetylmuramate dehydrogenase